MVVSFSSITGSWVDLAGDPPRRRQPVGRIEPLTSTRTLVDADGTVRAEPTTVYVEIDGTASITLPDLPQDDIRPAGAFYVFIPAERYDMAPVPFQMSGDLTWADIIDPSVIPNPTQAILDQIQALIDQINETPGSGTVTSVNGQTPTAGAVTLTKADFADLDQLDNTADEDKPVSTAQQAAIDDGDGALQTLIDNRWDKDTVTGVLEWFQGDTAPSWAAGTRPSGLRVHFFVDDAGSVPAWAQARDTVFIRSGSTYPEIRGVGGFTAMTSDSTTTDCTIPAETVDGDTLILALATNGTTPSSPPSGWTVWEGMLSGGSTNGLIIYTKTGVASEAGNTVTVTLSATTSAVATIIAFKGAVSIDVDETHTDDANTNSSQAFAAITPTADSLVIGISGIRYNALSGGTSVGTRAGWTELFDRTSAKAGAPQRGLMMTVSDAYGANGVTITPPSATTTQVVRTADYTISLTVA